MTGRPLVTFTAIYEALTVSLGKWVELRPFIARVRVKRKEAGSPQCFLLFLFRLKARGVLWEASARPFPVRPA